MAHIQPPQSNERKRVKVYELKNNDWFDRGTGFCTGQVINEEPKIFVHSEDQPDRILLETKISKDDGYQKQQETLIQWTDSNGTDMALSFQEANGCGQIWDFVSRVQQHLIAMAGPDDALSDDAMDSFSQSILLPPPSLNSLPEIDSVMRSATASPQGRDSLGKFVLAEDYVRRIVPLVETAEDLEDLDSLHRLSSIMKTFILLNDTQIIEHMMSDGIVDGVVGALEYDSDFPNHKANHREYLQNKSRFKEVVPIEDPTIKKKIHATWRLQYLKDVVLARILDDPTFSVLNSLIFFNQVDIVSHLQANSTFIKDLFGLVDDPTTSASQRKDAICFIQQCCAIAKNLQAQARAGLYQNFINNGLLNIIVLALGEKEAQVRVAATDILVAMIDHDPAMVRAHVFKAMNENTTPITDTLIDLLLVEEDLGVKAQAADAIKILLDPQQMTPQDGMARMGEQLMPKYRQTPGVSQQTETFIQDFYDNGARKLFAPLKALEKRASLADLTFNEQSLFLLLVEILMYFVRQHLFRSKYFIAAESISSQIARLLTAPQKHLKLTALKFFRQCLGLQDEFYYQQLTSHNVFGPILDIVSETYYRENLLNSACLELFDLIRRDQIKPIIVHVVENHRSQLEALADLELFEFYLRRYDQMQQGYEGAGMEPNLFGPDDETAAKVKLHLNGHGGRWQGMAEMDAQEEEYFNTSDEEDELAATTTTTTKPLGAAAAAAHALPNGSSPLMKPLVDYPEDDDDDEDDDPGLGGTEMRALYHRMVSQNDELLPDEEADVPDAAPPPTVDGADSSGPLAAAAAAAAADAASTAAAPVKPPERFAEKRRREAVDDDDELGKLSATKRRNSGGGAAVGSGKVLRRKGNLSSGASKDGGSGGGPGTRASSGSGGAGAGNKKIAISLSGAAKGSGANATSAAAAAAAAADEGNTK